MQRNNKFKFGVILGSGLDSLAQSMPGYKVVSEELDGVHAKRVMLVESEENPMVLLGGRKHFYEGYTETELTSNVRIAEEFGVENLLITNAAGGVNENFMEQDLMLIDSHVNLNTKVAGSRRSFPYDEDLKERFSSICYDLNLKLYSGTYVCLPGPAYETPSEIRLLRKIGADATGMSTVPEVSEAVNRGMKVVAVSVITNVLRENSLAPASHDSILETSKNASEKLLFVVKRLANELK